MPTEEKLKTNLLQINIISQLHVLGVDSQDLQATSCVRDANVHLTVKSTCNKQVHKYSSRSNKPLVQFHQYSTAASIHSTKLIVWVVGEGCHLSLWLSHTCSNPLMSSYADNSAELMEYLIITASSLQHQSSFSHQLTEATQGRVYTVGSVCGRHDDDVRSLLQTVHQGQQLGHDTTLHLSMGLAGKEQKHVHGQKESSTGIKFNVSNSPPLPLFFLSLFCCTFTTESSTKYLQLNCTYAPWLWTNAPLSL